ncbi:1270_t:CDS:10 [Entrophospora sp. SA101]|nr:1270_t:CDS:10 [Entrophospora sp. SA101]
MAIIESTTVYLVVATFLIGYYTYKWIIYPLYLSPLSKIPGPRPDHFLLGSFLEIIKPTGGVHWAEKYGNVYRCYGLFNEPRVYILDEKNIQKVLVNGAYTKFGRRKKFVEFLKKIVGDGILLVDGDVHKKQRKLMNPLFGNHSIRDMIPAFTRVSNTLKDLWKDEIKNSQNVNNDIDKKCAIIDVGHYMGRASLDVIGIVGFDSEINSLIKSSSLADSLSTLFDHKYGSAFNLLSLALPILRLLPLKINQDTQNASIEIEKITRKLVQDKFDELKKGKLDSNDLISVLVKASYGQEIDNNEQMSFEEIRNQIMTFLIAGHETTGVMMSWILYYLSKDQEIQDKLREEIVKEFPDKDSELNFDQINSMEYLNAVCKETLRIVPPVVLVGRTANEDVMIDEYLIPKDTPIFVPIYQIHHSPSIWGEDVEKFNPSRWFTEKVKGLTHYNFMPFSAGPKSCIGNRLALNEAKVILCNLLRNFQFHEVKGFKVTSKANMTLRPDPTVKLWMLNTDVFDHLSKSLFRVFTSAENYKFPLIDSDLSNDILEETFPNPSSIFISTCNLKTHLSLSLPSLNGVDGGDSLNLERLKSPITRINIFDFDGTLFASPKPNPKLWSKTLIGVLLNQFTDGKGWYQDSRSLDLGEPTESNKWNEWWNKGLLDNVKESMNDPKCLTVFLTGRCYAVFSETITKMLEDIGLHFDVLGFKPIHMALEWNLVYSQNSVKKLGIDYYNYIISQPCDLKPPASTKKYKFLFIDNLLKQHPLTDSIHIWEDRWEHINAFKNLFTEYKSQNIIKEGIVHGVEIPECYYDPHKEFKIVMDIIRDNNLKVSNGILSRYSKKIDLFRRIQFLGIFIIHDHIKLLFENFPPPKSKEYDWSYSYPFVLIKKWPSSNYIKDNDINSKRKKIVTMRITAMAIVWKQHYCLKVEMVEPNGQSKLENGFSHSELYSDYGIEM